MPDLQQTDQTLAFDTACATEPAGVTNVAVELVEGGTPGATEFDVDPDNLQTAVPLVMRSAGGLGIGTWDAGDHVVRLNVTTAKGTNTVPKIYICERLAGGTYATVEAFTLATPIDLSTVGVKSRTLTQSTSYTPAGTDSDVAYAFVVENTDQHGGSNAAITPSELITNPWQPTTFDGEVTAAGSVREALPGSVTVPGASLDASLRGETSAAGSSRVLVPVSSLELGIGTLTAPPTNENHRLFVRTAASGTGKRLKVELAEAGSMVASRILEPAVRDVPAGEMAETQVIELTAAEADAIADYGSLSVRLGEIDDGGGPGTQLYVTDLKVQVPEGGFDGELAQTATARVSGPGEVQSVGGMRVALVGEVTGDATLRAMLAGETTDAGSILTALAGEQTGPGSVRAALAGEVPGTAITDTAQTGELTGQASADAALRAETVGTGTVRAALRGELTGTGTVQAALRGQTDGAGSVREALSAETVETASARISTEVAGEISSPASTRTALRSELASVGTVRAALRGQAASVVTVRPALAGEQAGPASTRTAARGELSSEVTAATANRGTTEAAASADAALRGQVEGPVTVRVVVRGRVQMVTTSRTELPGQLLLPDADLSNPDGWTDEGGSGADLWASVDDGQNVDDADFVRSP